MAGSLYFATFGTFQSKQSSRKNPRWLCIFNWLYSADHIISYPFTISIDDPTWWQWLHIGCYTVWVWVQELGTSKSCGCQECPYRAMADHTTCYSTHCSTCSRKTVILDDPKLCGRIDCRQDTSYSVRVVEKWNSDVYNFSSKFFFTWLPWKCCKIRPFFFAEFWGITVLDYVFLLLLINNHFIFLVLPFTGPD